MSTRFEEAMDAVNALFGDTSVSQAVTRELLEDLQAEIDTMLDSMGDEE